MVHIKNYGGKFTDYVCYVKYNKFYTLFSVQYSLKFLSICIIFVNILKINQLKQIDIENWKKKLVTQSYPLQKKIKLKLIL